MATKQAELFAGATALPEGLVYRDAVLTSSEETDLIRNFERLDFEPFQFRGFVGRRRVASFGWKYDFNRTRLSEAPPIPDFLLALEDKVKTIRGSGGFDQVSVSEYQPGAGIGWHRDRPLFGEVVGISLNAACRFRLRRKTGDGSWARQSLDVLPCSGYLLSGAARWEWEHSIPPVETLRYSITFRRLLDRPQR